MKFDFFLQAVLCFESSAGGPLFGRNRRLLGPDTDIISTNYHSTHIAKAHLDMLNTNYPSRIYTPADQSL